MRTVSPIILKVQGGLLYKIMEAARWRIYGSTWGHPMDSSFQTVRELRRQALTYDQPRPAGGSKRTTLRVERAVWSSGPDGTENLLLLPLFDEEASDSKGILLFHLIFEEQASVQQKMAVLRALGTRYHDVMEWLEEISNSRSHEDVLAAVSPRDLVLAPVGSLVPRKSE